MGEQKLPNWVKTPADYESWRTGGGPVNHALSANQSVPGYFKIMVVAVIIVLVIGGVFYYAKSTPRYSLYQFRNAIVDRDAEKALKYLDIDSIGDNLMKAFMAKQDIQPAQNEWEQAGRNLGNIMIAAMLPTMKNNIKAALKNAITTNDESNLDNLKKGSLWAMDIDVDGHTAIVTNKADTSIKFRMAEADGYWKIVEIIMPRGEM